jgi:hypothetical protein
VSIHGFQKDVNFARRTAAQVFARRIATLFISLQYDCAGYYQRLALDVERGSIGLTKVQSATDVRKRLTDSTDKSDAYERRVLAFMIQALTIRNCLRLETAAARYASNPVTVRLFG